MSGCVAASALPVDLKAPGAVGDHTSARAFPIERKDFPTSRSLASKGLISGLLASNATKTINAVPVGSGMESLPRLLSSSGYLLSPSPTPLSFSSRKESFGLSRTQKKNRKRHVKRQVDRVAKQADSASVKGCALRYRNQAADSSVSAEGFSFTDMTPTKPGWRGRRSPRYKETYELGMLLDPSFGFREVPWDGVHPVALADQNGRVVGVLAGRPKGAEDWDAAVHRPACDAFEKVFQRCTFEDPGNQLPRRGDFPALDAGVSHGGGQVVCGSCLFVLHTTNRLLLAPQDLPKPD